MAEPQNRCHYRRLQLIASVLPRRYQIKRRHRGGHTNEDVKCVRASKCSNPNNPATRAEIARVNPNKLSPLTEPGRKWRFYSQSGIEEGERKTQDALKTSLDSLKKSLPPETRGGNRINLCSQCMCVFDTAEWFSSCLWGVISCGVACRCSTGLSGPETQLLVSSLASAAVCGERTPCSGPLCFRAWGVTLK